MNILVTGHKGFLGSYVMELFPKAIGYDIKDISEDNILNESHLLQILKKNQIDTIIHLAAYASVSDGEKHPQVYIKNNIEGTTSVIQVAIRAGVKKIVYASSSAASEPSSSIYAFTKYTPELLLEHYKDQIQAVSLRFFNIYGKGSNPSYGRVIDEFIKGIKAKGEVIIYGDGEQTRDFIHVWDATRAIKLAVEVNCPSGSVIEIGTGKSISIKSLASIIGKLMKVQPEINYVPARKEVKYSQADLFKANHWLDFKPEICLTDGLATLLSE